jgi:hypothetical protein
LGKENPYHALVIFKIVPLPLGKFNAPLSDYRFVVTVFLPD